MNGMFEARLLVELANHVKAHQGLARLSAAKTVAEAELALVNAKVADVSPLAAELLSDAVNVWLQGRDPAPYVLHAFWLDLIDRVQFRPVKFRLHVGAPCCVRPETGVFYLDVVQPSIGRKNFMLGGTLDGLRLDPHRGEFGTYPDDVVVWWEGRSGLPGLVELVQPGSTLTLLRPRRKQWWTSWAGLAQEDVLAGALYKRYNFTKLFVGEDPDFEFMIMGIEAIKP